MKNNRKTPWKDAAICKLRQAIDEHGKLHPKLLPLSLKLKSSGWKAPTTNFEESKGRKPKRMRNEMVAELIEGHLERKCGDETYRYRMSIWHSEDYQDTTLSTYFDDWPTCKVEHTGACAPRLPIDDPKKLFNVLRLCQTVHLILEQYSEPEPAVFVSGLQANFLFETITGRLLEHLLFNLDMATHLVWKLLVTNQGDDLWSLGL